MTDHELAQHEADVVDFVLNTPYGDVVSYNDIGRALKIQNGHVKHIVDGLDEPARQAVSRYIAD